MYNEKAENMYKNIHILNINSKGVLLWTEKAKLSGLREKMWHQIIRQQRCRHTFCEAISNTHGNMSGSPNSKCSHNGFSTLDLQSSQVQH